MDETRSVSVRLDGKASIEHQIDIHVQDLTAVSNGDFTLDEILQGLKYVCDYRINGGKMTSLDENLMKKLLEGLLCHMNGKEGTLLHQGPTAEAFLAVSLFVDFLQVTEFRHAVAQQSATDLCFALKIHRYCQPRSTEEQKRTAARLLGILTSSFPQFSDWKELVKEKEYDDVEKVIQDYSDVFKSGAAEVPHDEILYPPPALYFDKNVGKLAEMYKTNIQTGLTTSQVEEYREVFGPNNLPAPPKPSIWSMLWTQISDFMCVILMIVAIVEIITEDVKTAVILFIVVIVNVAIGFSQEFQANKAMEALVSLSVPKASVIRNGNQETVESNTLVPGDIVVLEEGDAIPADLRLCEVAQLEIIESILTGESVPVAKSTRTIRKRTRRLPLGDCKGNAFMSTVVAKGRGKGIVVRTGESSEIGKISKAIVQQPHQKTSIQKKLDMLGKILVVVAVLLCVLVIILGVAWGRNAGTMAKIGVSLAVSVIPEGLVVVVTVTMAIAVKRMAKQCAIVRKLPSVETLGSVTVICSDKTGTLTEGKMGTSELWTSDNSMYVFSESTQLDPEKGTCLKCTRPVLEEVVGNPSNAKQVTTEERKNAIEVSKSVDKAPAHLLMSCLVNSLCNNAAVTFDQETNKWVPLGDPTEVALVTATQKAGFPKVFWMNECKLVKMGEYAFDSERKLMSSLYTQESVNEKLPIKLPDGTCLVLAKGAPEGILTRCVAYLAPASESSFQGMLDSFQTREISDAYSEYISQQSSVMAESGLRVLALAARKVTVAEGEAIIASKKSSEAEKDLVFVGLVGLIDPPKQGVSDSIASCKRAGIKVFMITGDHIATATSIAKQIGIIDSNFPDHSRSMRGFEIDLLSEEALAELKPFPVVFARVSPDNKLKIVRALQSKGNSVAMTGDGVNDAPAIKKADVGVAMGIGGTEITKQAADIVLADDNFVSIVAAVREGRRVFDNIKKFVVYLLSCNSAEIFLFLLAAGCNLELPFSIIQILWANLIADIPPATSLGLEPFELDVMDRPPRPPSEGVLTWQASFIILSQGSILSLITFIIYLLSQGQGLSSERYKYLIGQPAAFLYPTVPTLFEQRCLAFFVLTSMQLFQSFLSRSVSISVFRTGVTGNKWCVYAFVLSYGLLVAGFYIPGLNNFLELRPLTATDWAVSFVCLAIQIFLIESLKYGVRVQNKNKYKKLQQKSNA